MTRALLLVVLIPALGGIAACGNQEAPLAAKVEQVRQESEKRVHDANRQRLEAEKARIEADKARKEAEDSKEYWKTVAWMLALVVVIALVVGVAMGSSARKDATSRKPPVE